MAICFVPFLFEFLIWPIVLLNIIHYNLVYFNIGDY